MICRITCKVCGRTWVFDSKFLNPAEYACPFHKETVMNKKVTVRKDNGTTGENTEVHAETIEQALRELADKVESGEVKPPFDLEFDGPGGLQFTVSVNQAEDVHELARQGFMF